jgi:hypothetical protein
MWRERLITRITPEAGNPFHVAGARLAVYERGLRPVCTLECVQELHQLAMNPAQNRSGFDRHPDRAPTSARSGHRQAQWFDSGQRRSHPIDDLVDPIRWDEVLRQGDVRQHVAA